MCILLTVARALCVVQAEELERLEQRMKLTRVRADAAKESFHNCVYQYKGIVKEDEDGGGEGK